MITTIKIEPQMNCEYICQKIQQAVTKYQMDSPDMSDTLIVIDIKKISANDDSLIPKLEHKTE
jgi:uncharacterized protein YihD (DUF1040 family)